MHICATQVINLLFCYTQLKRQISFSHMCDRSNIHIHVTQVTYLVDHYLEMLKVDQIYTLNMLTILHVGLR